MRFAASALFLLMALIPPAAQAKIFRNSYVSFELPPKWDCTLDDTEWVCRSTYKTADAREAIIILTAKEAGPMDSLTEYERHLKTVRNIPSKTGALMPSKIIQVKTRNINSHAWVDGLHLGSEIPNYYTRYMATVKDRIGILVTFSAHKTVYTKYSNDFFKAIESLRVVTSRALVNPAAMQRSGGETLGVNIQPEMAYDADYPEEMAPGSGGSTLNNMILALAVLLGGAGVYLFLKKGKKTRR